MLKKNPRIGIHLWHSPWSWLFSHDLSRMTPTAPLLWLTESQLYLILTKGSLELSPFFPPYIFIVTWWVKGFPLFSCLFCPSLTHFAGCLHNLFHGPVQLSFTKASKAAHHDSTFYKPFQQWPHNHICFAYSLMIPTFQVYKGGPVFPSSKGFKCNSQVVFCCFLLSAWNQSTWLRALQKLEWSNYQICRP